MNKLIPTSILIFTVLTANSFGQEMLNVNTYYPLFSIIRSADIVYSDYVLEAAYEEIVFFGSLNSYNSQNEVTWLVDTPLEFALLSYYSSALRNIRPVQANEILPADNPRLAGLRLGAALYQDIQVFRFLANNQAVEKYEEILRFVCDRNGVTLAEIETFYRNNIRVLVSQVVDDEFRYPTEQVRRNNQTGINTIPPAFVNEVKQSISDFYLTPTTEKLNKLRDLTIAIILRTRYADTLKAWRLNAAFEGETDTRSSVLERRSQNYLRQMELITITLSPNSNFRIADDNPSFWSDTETAYLRVLHSLNQEIANRATVSWSEE